MSLEVNKDLMPRLERLTPEEAKEELQNLTKSLGWALLVRYGASQVDGRSLTIINTLACDPEGLAQENFGKGEISGIKLFFSFPQTLLENIDVDTSETNNGGDSGSSEE